MSFVLSVVRDSSCIQDKIKYENNFVFLMKSQEFFDRLKFYTFLEDLKFVSDNDALFLVASDVLIDAESKQFLKAAHYVSFIKEIFKSGICFEEISNKVLSLSDECAHLKTIFSDLNRIISRLIELKKIDNDMALKEAILILQKKKRLPAFLEHFSSVKLENLNDLTVLEQNAITALKELGLSIEHQETFFNETAFNHGDLFFDKKLEVQAYLANDVVQEARWLAGVIAFLRSSSRNIPRIAVALRSFDERALFFKDALMAHGIAIKDYQTRKLSYSKTGRLLIQKPADDVLYLMNLKNKVAAQATLKEYIKATLNLLEEEIKIDLEGYESVKNQLSHAFDLVGVSSKNISLHDFTKWLERLLSRESLPSQTKADDNAVEILPLEKVSGRRFDYVAVVDMVHGRLPKASEVNPLLTDKDRLFLNQLLEKPFFVLSEDVLNSKVINLMPSLQSLESTKFLNALKAAKKGLLFTSSRQDQSKREQAQSEYFDAVIDALNKDKFSESALLGNRVLNHLETKFLQAKYWLKTKEKMELLTEEVHALNLYSTIKEQRDRFFKKSPEISFFEVADEFAFKSKPQVFRKRFSAYLGLNSSKPLNDTRIEALARCRFRGFVEGMLKVNTYKTLKNDVDARVLGKLAHKVLEDFYRVHGAVDEASFNHQKREHLTSLLNKHAKFYFNEEAAGHRAVMNAYIKWLNNALVRLVSNLAKVPPIEGVLPRDFELSIAPISFLVGDETLYFGGVIDRVDEGKNARVVVDYKLSNLASIRKRVGESQVFKSHFQIPLYLKLLEHHRPSDASAHLFGYLISISDGTTSPILGLNRVKDLKRRVLDNEADGGLVFSLHQLLKPVLQGIFPADVNDKCVDCQLKRVCRVPTNQVALSDELEENVEDES